MSIAVVCTDLNDICGINTEIFYRASVEVSSFVFVENSLEKIKTALKYAFETSEGVCVVYTKNSWSNIQKAMLMEFERSSVFVEGVKPYVIANGFKPLSEGVYFDFVYEKPFMFISNELKENEDVNEFFRMFRGGVIKIGVFDVKIKSRHILYADEAETIIAADSSELEKIKNSVKENKIYTTKGETPQRALFNILQEKNVSISTAESCTAGLITASITDIPGSSRYFSGGCVTYSNEFKSRYLGVNSHTLQSFGAVSQEVSVQMAAGVLNNSKTDFSVAVTGIAGPGGGSEEKPVGLVYISAASRRNIETRRMVFSGNRRIIRHKTARFALLFLREFILSQ